MTGRITIHLFAWPLLGALFYFCSRATVRASTRILRVMTFNIHHAEGLDGVIDTQRIADLEANDDLGSNTWTFVPTSLQGQERQAVITPSEGSRFFRLQRIY